MDTEKQTFSNFHKSPQSLVQLSPSILLSQDLKPLKRTKTVCTIGPKSQSPQNAGKLIDEGMTVARLNFSHGDHQSQRIQMLAVQEAANSRNNCHVSIMLDTKGPQIRTGLTANKEPIQLKTGQLLQITTNYDHLCTNTRISCSYKDLPTSTSVGSKILIADGGISTKVVKIDNDIVTVQVLNDGKFGSRKNMCLPGTVVNLSTIGSADEKDIIQFGLKHKVDFIAISFSRYKKDLDNLRKLLIEKDPEHGSRIQLISKIENHQAIHNIDEIIDGSDGIMIARGDLGMQVPIQKVVILQKYITQRAINAGKFVITATQMVQSMETKPRPTRAEVSDITNSVYDLTDANMTSGETANGQFPTETVRYMKLIAQEAQATCNYKKCFEQRKKYIKDKESVAIIQLSFTLQCNFIFIETCQVKVIHRLSTLRPKSYIIVFTDNETVKRALTVDFGVYCYPKKYKQQNVLEPIKSDFGLKTQQSVRILQIQINKEGSFTSKFRKLDLKIEKEKLQIIQL